jgi:aminopeptidase N
MLETIRYLSDREQEGRGLGSPGLDRAAEFIAQRFREAGLEPLGDLPGSYFQTWNETSGDSRTDRTLKNVIGYIPGKKKEFSGQNVIVGAHYDHLGLGWPDAREGNKGKIHPGADDNASGVAVLVELAQILVPAFTPDRSILFIAFTGEEAGRRGSHYYVKASREGKYPVEKAIGMINIDTVGRLGEKKLLILGGNSAREWVHIFRGAGYMSGVEIEMVQEDLDSSDQTIFQRAGVPAVQLFTGAHADYHRPTDTADKIDAHGLINVASAAREVIEYLAKRESGLSATIETGGMTPERERGKRKVSLGIVPDFSYRGKGIRLSGTVPGSPAEKSGLTQGDILIRIHSSAVDTLKDLADILSSYKPGTLVSLTILREGQETTFEAELADR